MIFNETFYISWQWASTQFMSDCTWKWIFVNNELNKINLWVVSMELMWCSWKVLKETFWKAPVQKQPFVDLLQNRCLCWSLFLIKLWAGLQLYLKRFQYRCFPVNIAKFSRTSFLQSTFSGCFRESWNSHLSPFSKIC